MVRVIVVVVGGGGDGGKIFLCPLDDLLAKSRSKNFGRSSNSKNPDEKKFFVLAKSF